MQTTFPTCHLTPATPVFRRTARSVYALVAVFLCLSGSGLAQADALRSGSDERVRIYQLALAQRMGEPARAVYQAVDGDGRRLLAARSYLRVADSLPSRWSWSNDRIEQFNRSLESRALAEEIARIVAEFERRNPGYSLYANMEVRSVEVQLERWNTNPTVAKVAAQLQRAAEQHLMQHDYPGIPDHRALDRFSKFLVTWQSATKSPLAAPGLSAHGRARAIDFAIRKGERIVAPTDMSSVSAVWDGQGWTGKLQAAVQAASTKFKGPLASPREPWHYEYTP